MISSWINEALCAENVWVSSLSAGEHVLWCTGFRPHHCRVQLNFLKIIIHLKDASQMSLSAKRCYKSSRLHVWGRGSAAAQQPALNFLRRGLWAELLRSHQITFFSLISCWVAAGLKDHILFVLISLNICRCLFLRYTDPCDLHLFFIYECFVKTMNSLKFALV